MERVKSEQVINTSLDLLWGRRRKFKEMTTEEEKMVEEGAERN
jgi:hypothetical protein